MKAVVIYSPTILEIKDPDKGFQLEGKLWLVVEKDGTCHILGQNGTFKTLKGIRGDNICELHSNFDQSSFYAVTCDKRIFSWGSNTTEELGHPKEDDDEDVWCLFSPDECPPQFIDVLGVKQIAVGLYHVLALTINGQVYSWGCNLVGQLGHGILEYTPSTPTLIEHPFDHSRILHVSCSRCLSVALTEMKQIFLWGKTTKGVFYEPTLMTASTKFRQVMCTANHCFGLTEENKLYLLCFQCAANPISPCSLVNSKYDMLSTIVTFHQIAIGYEVTSVFYSECSDNLIYHTSKGVFSLNTDHSGKWRRAQIMLKLE